MKTEQIEVSHFEGFECVGMCIPDNGMYLFSSRGIGLIPAWPGATYQLCYKKIKPKTITLMHIPLGIAQEGDYIQGSCGDLYKVVRGVGQEKENLWRPI